MKQASKYILLLISAIVLCADAVFAASVNVQVPSRVVQGERLQLTYVVTNGDARMTKDQAPTLSGCTLLFGPSLSTIQSYQIVNGRQSASVSKKFTYTYQTEKAGKVTIPSITIEVDGQPVKTKSAVVEILPPSASQQRRQQQQQYAYDPWDDLLGGIDPFNFNPFPTTPIPEPSRVESKISANDLIIRVSMSKNKVYENEAVIATIKLYVKDNVDISSFQPKIQPQFEGFLSEELPIDNQKPVREHINGENYSSVVLKRCLLFPTKTGRLTINSGEYDVTLVTYDIVSNGYMQTGVPREHPVVAHSKSISVDVSPLPAPAPATFNKAVGDFNVTAKLSPEQLRTNEPAKYIVKISGTGNIQHLYEPILTFPESFETYSPQGTSDAQFNGSTMQGEYTVEYTLVPTETGSYTIPAWDFTFFNPATGQYETRHIDAIAAEVSKGLPSTSSSADTFDSDELSDIRNIVKVDPSRLSRRPSYIFYSPVYWACYAAALIVLVSAVIIYRSHIKSMSDLTAVRTRRARRVATERLRKARAAMNSHNADRFYEKLAAAIWGYLSDKLKMPASSLTRENIQGTLESRSASPELIAEVISIIDSAEMARFTPGHTDAEMSELYSRAASAINALESLKLSPSAKNPDSGNTTSRYGDIIS